MKNYISYLLLLTPFFSIAQDIIKLENPSFEDVPRAGAVPKSWINFGKKSETPPDIQPGSFQVSKNAKHGNTYLGMVVRDNNTNESIGQKLSQPLKAGKRYTLSFFAARSEIYLSQSPTTKKPSNYSVPVKIAFYGCITLDCYNKDLLFRSAVTIENTEWQEYEVELIATQDAEYLIIAIEQNRVNKSFPYNGNLLLDNFSDIVEIVK